MLAFFLAIQLSFAAGNLGERLARRAGSHRGVLIATVPFLAYLIYLAGTNSFTWWRAAFAAAYTLTPVLLTISAGAAKPGAWQDYLAMLAIFLPLKMRLLNGLWPYGGPTIGYVATMLLAISVALATFLFVRQFDGVGYNIVWGRDAVFAVLLHFGLLAIIVIPLGTAMHFIRFDPAQAHWKSLPADAISIFLLTAWPEELLFRGLAAKFSFAHALKRNGRLDRRLRHFRPRAHHQQRRLSKLALRHPRDNCGNFLWPHVAQDEQHFHFRHRARPGGHDLAPDVSHVVVGRLS